MVSRQAAALHIVAGGGLKRALHYSAILRRGPVRFPGWYPRDHKPGDFPRTEEERRASAIRYGMRPEDYKPLPEGQVSLKGTNAAGDYPDLGHTTYGHRDPYEDWSDSLNRRNWNEPVPKDHMMYRADRMTMTGLENDDFKPLKVIFYICQVVIPIILLGMYIRSANPDMFKWKNPAMPKQYPYDFYRAWPFDDPLKYPITNYSFEPAEE